MLAEAGIVSENFRFADIAFIHSALKLAMTPQEHALKETKKRSYLSLGESIEKHIEVTNVSNSEYKNHTPMARINKGVSKYLSRIFIYNKFAKLKSVVDWLQTHYQKFDHFVKDAESLRCILELECDNIKRTEMITSQYYQSDFHFFVDCL